MAAVARGAKRGLRLAAGAALGALLAGCLGPRGDDVPAHVREIEARNRHMEAQFRRGNLLGVADVYADDAVMVNPRGERTAGRAELDAYWSGIEEPLDWRLEVREIRGSDAVAYELGTSHLTKRRDGEVRTSVVDFLLLWKRDARGEWVIELDAYWPAED